MHQPVVHVLNLDSEVPMLREPGLHRLTCTFPKLRLYPGHYYLSFYFGASDPKRQFDAPSEICPFEVAVLIKFAITIGLPTPHCTSMTRRGRIKWPKMYSLKGWYKWSRCQRSRVPVLR